MRRLPLLAAALQVVLVAATPHVAAVTETTRIDSPRTNAIGADGHDRDRFGSDVVIVDGTTVLVGVDNDDVGGSQSEGSVQELREIGGSWVVAQKITASDPQPAMVFGRSLGLSANTLVVGAPGTRVDGRPQQGAAYVYVRSGGAWTFQAKLLAPDGAAFDRFGTSVAIDGDTILVGAPETDSTEHFQQGSVYAFQRGGSAWSFAQEIVASDPGDSELFGQSIAMTGDDLIVGAPSDGSGVGSAVAFRRNAGAWQQRVRFQAPLSTVGTAFGWQVAISGDYFVAGAPNEEVESNAFRGAAYVYRRPATDWQFHARLIAADGEELDGFGEGVRIDGTSVVVGARGAALGNTRQGAAYVFVRTADAWALQARIDAEPLQPEALFGAILALSGDTLLVGTPNLDVTGHDRQGAVFLFTRAGTQWQQSGHLRVASGFAYDEFGVSMDVDGGTAIIGTRSGFGFAGQNQRGVAHVYSRGAAGWVEQARLVGTPGTSVDGFGGAVSISGDVAVVGASLENDQVGAAYIFTRSGSTWTQVARLVPAVPRPGSAFGASVELRGDVALVGAPLEDVGGSTQQGAAYVFVRQGNEWSEQARLQSATGVAFDFFGDALVLVENVAIVGAPGANVASGINQGAAYCFTRAGALWSESQRILADDGVAFDEFGGALAASGQSLVVGAARAAGSNGAAYVFTEVGGNWVQQQRLITAAGAVGDLFGASVAIRGDDVLVGAPAHDFGGDDLGAAYAFRRATSLWTPGPVLSAAVGGTRDLLGSSVAFDGDRALVGVPGSDQARPFGNPDQGAVYEFVIDVLFADGFEVEAR